MFYIYAEQIQAGLIYSFNASKSKETGTARVLGVYLKQFNTQWDVNKFTFMIMCCDLTQWLQQRYDRHAYTRLEATRWNQVNDSDPT